MPRLQLSLKTLLWLMALVASFFAGSAWQRHIDEVRRDAIRAQILCGSDWLLQQDYTDSRPAFR
jgi:hypothetical protein